DTLGGAVEVARQLPGDLGTALLGAARDAFVTGMHVAAAISAAVGAGDRHPRRGHAPQGQGEARVTGRGRDRRYPRGRRRRAAARLSGAWSSSSRSPRHRRAPIAGAILTSAWALMTARKVGVPRPRGETPIRSHARAPH
ncbi:MAG: hypothetical protein WD770_00390, partial [Actinomycetota bacterium]